MRHPDIKIYETCGKSISTSVLNCSFLTPFHTISGHLIGHPIFQHQTQKHLKKHLLYCIRYSIMPFLVIDGHNMKIDNNTFDTMGKFNVLSKQTQTAVHLSTLRNKHLKQNKYIKT